VLAYATRRSSTQDINLAVVLRAEERRARVKVIVGTDGRWESGDTRWNGSDWVPTPYEGYETTLHAGSVAIIVNGMDVAALKEQVIGKQRTALEAKRKEFAARRHCVPCVNPPVPTDPPRGDGAGR